MALVGVLLRPVSKCKRCHGQEVSFSNNVAFHISRCQPPFDLALYLVQQS